MHLHKFPLLKMMCRTMECFHRPKMRMTLDKHRLPSPKCDGGIEGLCSTLLDRPRHLYFGSNVPCVFVQCKSQGPCVHPPPSLAPHPRCCFGARKVDGEGSTPSPSGLTDSNQFFLNGHSGSYLKTQTLGPQTPPPCASPERQQTSPSQGPPHASVFIRHQARRRPGLNALHDAVLAPPSAHAGHAVVPPVHGPAVHAPVHAVPPSVRAPLRALPPRAAGPSLGVPPAGDVPAQFRGVPTPAPSRGLSASSWASRSVSARAGGVPVRPWISRTVLTRRFRGRGRPQAVSRFCATNAGGYSAGGSWRLSDGGWTLTDGSC